MRLREFVPESSGFLWAACPLTRIFSAGGAFPEALDFLDQLGLRQVSWGPRTL